jgi:TATA-box binding protein (TBP) (component of TFIID and TFIIIB)
MQNIIAIEVLSTTLEKGFSLDELVFRTKELFEKKGLTGFVGLIFRLTDEKICMNILVQNKHFEKLII